MGFAMDAPLEKIRGRVSSSAIQGWVWFDEDQPERIFGTFRVDLAGLELFQRRAEEGQFGGETESSTQNEHVRNWLEDDEDAPVATRNKNRQVSFEYARPTAVLRAVVQKPFSGQASNRAEGSRTFYPASKIGGHERCAEGPCAKGGRWGDTTTRRED